MRGLIAFTLSLVMLAGPAYGQTRADPEAGSGLTPKPLASARTHMIAAAHPAAAEAGRGILRRGGSAADAAIAALLVLNVVEPQSSGIGGGAFALVHSATGITSWDARETAPAGATPDMFLGAGGQRLPFLEAVASGRSVGVPGLARLMEAIYIRHGKLPWADLFAPAIRLARGGFPVSPRLADSILRYRDRLATTDAAALFLPGGEPLAAGRRAAGRGDSSAHPGAGGHLSEPRRERPRRALFRPAGPGHRRRYPNRPPARRPDSGGPRRLRGHGTSGSLPRLPRPVPGLRHGPALVRGHHGGANPRAARPLQAR
jgi:hypothetical protein